MRTRSGILKDGVSVRLKCAGASITEVRRKYSPSNKSLRLTSGLTLEDRALRALNCLCGASFGGAA